ncbi:hypothetical protein [Sphingomonas adhaesiva]|uniref:hypothetical protein n=1 Tax=Sphingomonas adhaesiva TaxID=28212 RepID=UPI000ADD74D7|nr:hypothetical protein [Sphingomonas adhaesiva]
MKDYLMNDEPSNERDDNEALASLYEWLAKAFTSEASMLRDKEGVAECLAAELESLQNFLMIYSLIDEDGKREIKGRYLEKVSERMMFPFVPINEALSPDLSSVEAVRELVASRLEWLSPSIFDISRKQFGYIVVIDELISALRALNAGETQPLMRPAKVTRAASAHTINKYRLKFVLFGTEIRMSGLNLDLYKDYLDDRGIKLPKTTKGVDLSNSQKFDYLVSRLVACDWASVRRWRTSAEKVLDKETTQKVRNEVSWYINDEKKSRNRNLMDQFVRVGDLLRAAQRNKGPSAWWPVERGVNLARFREEVSIRDHDSTTVEEAITRAAGLRERE